MKRTQNTMQSPHKEKGYLRISCEQFEGLIYLWFLYTATKIQEVGWFPTIQEDDITSSHGQSSTIHCKMQWHTQQGTFSNMKGCMNFSSPQYCKREPRHNGPISALFGIPLNKINCQIIKIRNQVMCIQRITKGPGKGKMDLLRN